MSKRRIAFVTGGAVGIGRAVILRLAQDGFDIAFNYRTSETSAHLLQKTVQKIGRTCLSLRGDVSREASVRTMLKAIKKTYGRLDAVVHNAAINQAQPIAKVRTYDFKKMFEVNVLGTALVTKHALPLLRRSNSAHIVFISSVNAFRGSRDKPAYVASKAALLGLVRALALELAPDILVNAIAPGSIDTEMFRMLKTESVAKRIKKIPLGRIGRPEDIAGVVSFLCSEDSSYITGQCIHANGGIFFG